MNMKNGKEKIYEKIAKKLKNHQAAYLLSNKREIN